MTPYIWLILIVVGVIVEAASPQLVSIWFVLGFIVALILNFCGVNVAVQIAAAIVVSIATLILTKPLVKKIMTTNSVNTNADRNIGKIAIVTDEIGTVTGTGRVNVQGASWAAFSKEGKVISVGEKVVIESIEGVKLSVKLKEE